MMVSMRHVAVFVYVFAGFGYVFSSYSISYASESVCRRQSYTFVHDLRSQCPIGISFPFSSPVEVDRESVDRALVTSEKDDVTAVLFYASWCPFSTEVKSKFSALSSMFPQIKHVMVEQSKAMPSVFSRYGIHSLPSILLVNQTVRVQYHGQKNLHYLVNFYERTTGLNPVIYLTENQIIYAEGGHKAFQLWNVSSLKNMFSSEPYLVLSVAFVILRASLLFFPKVVSHLVSLWVAYGPHPNIGIFGESRQLLGRVFHVINPKRLWSKLKLCKARNFQKRARSARVWAYL